MKVQILPRLSRPDTTARWPFVQPVSRRAAGPPGRLAATRAASRTGRLRPSPPRILRPGASSPASPGRAPGPPAGRTPSSRPARGTTGRCPDTRGGLPCRSPRASCCPRRSSGGLCFRSCVLGCKSIRAKHGSDRGGLDRGLYCLSSVHDLNLRMPPTVSPCDWALFRVGRSAFPRFDDRRVVGVNTDRVMGRTDGRRSPRSSTVVRGRDCLDDLSRARVHGVNVDVENRRDVSAGVLGRRPDGRITSALLHAPHPRGSSIQRAPRAVPP